MAFSNQNPAERHQPENSISESIEVNSSKEDELKDLLNLLADLKIIDHTDQPSQHPKSEQQGITSDQPDNIEQSHSSGDLEVRAIEHQIDHGINSRPPRVQEKEALAQERDQPQSFGVKVFPHQNPSPQLPIAKEHLPQMPHNSEEPVLAENLVQSEATETNQDLRSDSDRDTSQELDTLAEILQELVISPEMSQFRDQIETLGQRQGRLEHQIDQPQELIKLLLPVMAKLLDLTVDQFSTSVTDSLTPIIDEVIGHRTQQDKEGVGEAIAPAVPIAISSCIEKCPEEVGFAIAPEMAVAIRQQITLKRDAIGKAIAPEMAVAIRQQITLKRNAIGKAIGPEMAVAIREQITLKRYAIGKAIGPEMEAAIREQIRHERDAMVRALYPVIGSTISKYLAEEIRAINDKVENALSIEGMMRKIRAKVQGVSEAELLFREVMLFRARAIFLIHKDSGLVIAEVQPSDSQHLESDMVAGMLTAIRSFVNDCIAQSGDVAEIDAIDYGTSKIILEVEGYCYLAVVVEGEPTQQFIHELRESLETIVTHYGKPIRSFDGDTTTIPVGVKGILENLLDQSVSQGRRDTQENPKKGKKPPGLLVVGLGLLGLIAVFGGIYQHRARINRRIEQKTQLALAYYAPEVADYGLTVKANRQILKLAGQLPNQALRSNVEQIAKAAVPKLELDNRIEVIELPYTDELTKAQVQRVSNTLNQMDGVVILAYYTEGRVTVNGAVLYAQDFPKIIQAFENIPGVKSVENNLQLQGLDLSSRIYFDLGSAQLKPEDIGTKIRLIKEFLQRYPQKNLRIIGYADPRDKLTENQGLAQQRAQTVKNVLVQQGIDSKRLQVRGLGKGPPDVDASQPLWLNRCVVFDPFTKKSS
ncbi:MAG: OmpA family protein [Moorea sp. SIO3C2]|nr:OmpA family protein [Moorena sp. SIO3C2]